MNITPPLTDLTKFLSNLDEKTENLTQSKTTTPKEVSDQVYFIITLKHRYWSMPIIRKFLSEELDKKCKAQSENKINIILVPVMDLLIKLKDSSHGDTQQYINHRLKFPY
ncbi:hypothetical protein HZS_3662 [Henneguya salminicola]|nr:hypothetical protein HZS_3662 [Henneguya salminicola]